MTPEAYSQFTSELQRRLEADPRVLGLVALGSMAARDYLPDAWSDHDFFVVVQAGEQEGFRTDLSWLPEAERIAFHVRETAHGLKVVYEDGHLLEFAVFDVEELNLAQINRYRVLVDRGGVTEQLAAIEATTRTQIAKEPPTDEHLFGMFLTLLLVGVGRHRRGERLSGRLFVKTHALRYLLMLLARHGESPQKGRLDNLDPFRRVEMAFPALGEALNAVLEEETPEAARGMLRLAQREVAGPLREFPQEAVEAIRRKLDE